ncbi:7640_t:CDS:2 [Gigaspora margarita]|uniref:7640_t:CDS:1 n=1 Tax=Gigaspora margarita TaxID=4874 RepID=A0ABN7VPJ1_GIGMA|nr:7640_t:CDS:2 [Gigaspora margarita]
MNPTIISINKCSVINGPGIHATEDPYSGKTHNKPELTKVFGASSKNKFNLKILRPLISDFYHEIPKMENSKQRIQQSCKIGLPKSIGNYTIRIAKTAINC